MTELYASQIIRSRTKTNLDIVINLRILICRQKLLLFCFSQKAELDKNHLVNLLTDINSEFSLLLSRITLHFNLISVLYSFSVLLQTVRNKYLCLMPYVLDIKHRFFFLLMYTVSAVCRPCKCDKKFKFLHAA
jgi:hypothetical protein